MLMLMRVPACLPCRDGRISPVELRNALAPFVPGPPESRLQAAVEAYKANGNLPGLLSTLAQVQAALLPAACVQYGGAIVPAGAPATAPPCQPLAPANLDSLVKGLLGGLSAGVVLPPNEVLKLSELISAGGMAAPSRVMSLDDFVAAVHECGEAVKRAASIRRCGMR